jgi:2,3-bisphosphoglycerate-independent phosphoglycerate mutase
MFKLPIFGNKNHKIKPVVLVVLDGFGVAPSSEGNAIGLARKPNIDYYWKNFPHGELLASGESVGLPADEVGNTEVGHLTMGAGRVVLQYLKRIDLAIEKGQIFDNQALLAASSHVKKNNSSLHIMGLVSSGSVHSSIGHLYGLLEFCKKEEIAKVCIHMFTDGRDAPPNASIEVAEKLEGYLETSRIARIVSVSGRYYAMDRDKRWSRTEKVYKAMVLGQGITASSTVEAIKTAYEKGQTDEFIEPTLIIGQEKKPGLIEDNDAVIFFNYRVDRPRQLTMSFVLPDFENLEKFHFGDDPDTNKEEGEVKISGTFIRQKVPKNLYFVTMTDYQKNLPVSAVAFKPEYVSDPLGRAVSEAGIRQLRMTESEKERFVTYYFNGLKEGPFEGEDVLIIPSPKVATYDKKPEMSINKLTSEFIKQIRRDIYGFALINFPNPDMVGHSGNIKATILAIEAVDKYLRKLVQTVLNQNGTVLVTADHGNAEELLTFPSSSFFFTSAKGSVNTEHSSNPVPLLVLSNPLKGNKTVLPRGGLSDLAPTICKLLNIPVCQGMTGKNLLSSLQQTYIKSESVSENLMQGA